MNRKYKNIFFLLMLVFLFFFSLTAVPLIAESNKERKFISITVQEASELIKENKLNEDFFIIDVRTPAEFDSGHIENSEMIDFYSEDFISELGKLDKSKVYLVYCRSGNRSGRTLKMMEDMGFTTVYNVLGGINSWSVSGLPLVR